QKTIAILLRRKNKFLTAQTQVAPGLGCLHHVCWGKTGHKKFRNEGPWYGSFASNNQSKLWPTNFVADNLIANPPNLADRQPF
ncbi:MAG: hypothetical protein F6K35_31210, partial [Okeania sp. SIO2H7]|nr:hypothetical protein [Okeania sp. SIO2H7]